MSFVANVNKIAQYIDYIAELNEYLSREDIEILIELSKVRLNSLKEDIDKGTFYGQRKIEFNLVENYIGYSEELDTEQLKELYNDPNNAVKYTGVTLYDINNVSVYYPFKHVETDVPISITTSIELYNQLIEILKDNTHIVDTNVNYVTHEVFNHITLVNSALVNGSNLQKAVLHVDTSVYNYKQDATTFAWVGYTSSLIVLSDHLDALITLYNNLDSLLGSEGTLEDITIMYGNIQTQLNVIKGLAEQVTVDKEIVEGIAQDLKELKVANTITLNPIEPAVVTYDGVTNSFTFSIPQGVKGDPMTPSGIDILANRGLYDSETKGFMFLASDTGLLYIKNSNAVGDWGIGIEFGQGPEGPRGLTGEQGPPGSIEGLEYASVEKEGIVMFASDVDVLTNTGERLDEKPITVSQYHVNAGRLLDSAKAYVGTLNGYTLNISNVAGRDTLTFIKR